MRAGLAAGAVYVVVFEMIAHCSQINGPRARMDWSQNHQKMTNGKCSSGGGGGRLVVCNDKVCMLVC